MGALEELREHRLRRPDGQGVAWTEWGAPDGVPLLRLPGTPGGRWSVRSDTTPWAERGLRVITTERPGSGASTRLPERGFAEHADDLAGRTGRARSGGGAPDRFQRCLGARAVLRSPASAARTGDDDHRRRRALDRGGVGAGDLPQPEAAELVRAGDLAALWQWFEEVYRAFVADPIAALGDVSDGIPDGDRAVLSSPAWQQVFTATTREALRPGPDGWGARRWRYSATGPTSAALPYGRR